MAIQNPAEYWVIPRVISSDILKSFVGDRKTWADQLEDFISEKGKLKHYDIKTYDVFKGQAMGIKKILNALNLNKHYGAAVKNGKPHYLDLLCLFAFGKGKDWNSTLKKYKIKESRIFKRIGDTMDEDTYSKLEASGYERFDEVEVIAKEKIEITEPEILDNINRGTKEEIISNENEKGFPKSEKVNDETILSDKTDSTSKMKTWSQYLTEIVGSALRKNPKISITLLAPNIYPFSYVSFDNGGHGYIDSVNCWLKIEIKNTNLVHETLQHVLYKENDHKEKSLRFLPVKTLIINEKGVSTLDVMDFPVQIKPNSVCTFYIFVEFNLPDLSKSPLYELYKAKIENLNAFSKAQEIIHSTDGLKEALLSNNDKFNHYMAGTYGVKYIDYNIGPIGFALPAKLQSGELLSYSEKFGILPHDFEFTLFKKINDGKMWDKLIHDYKENKVLFTFCFENERRVNAVYIGQKKPFWFFTSTLKIFNSKNETELTEKQKLSKELNELIKGRKFPEAKRVFLKIREEEKAPMDAYYYWCLGGFERPQGNYEIALSFFQKANELSRCTISFLRQCCAGA